jgi:hypothetical protein
LGCEAGKYSETGASAIEGCLTCDTGKYSDVRSGYCATVEAGEEVVKDGELRVGAVSCIAGRYSTGSADSCTSCGTGFSNEGASKCEYCGPGKYMHEEATTKECLGCVAGKYSETGASSIEGCFTCGAGEYSSEGAGFCITVEAGKEVVKDGEGLRIATSDCPAGRYNAGSNDECFNCEKVRSAQPTQPAANRTKTRLLTFHSACFSRSQGKFTDGRGQSSCEFCDTKVWKSTTFPELVPPTMSMTSDQCMCDAGKFEKVVCRDGEDGDGDVLPCPHSDVVVKAGRPTCVLLEELNALSMNATANETKRGMTTQTLDLVKGFWRVTENSTRVLDCKVPGNCLGGDNMTAMCIEGTTGPFCDVCDAENGYAKQAGECVACEGDRSKTVTAMSAAACSALVFAIAFACIATQLPGCAAKLEGLFKRLRKLHKLAGKYKVQVSWNPRERASEASANDELAAAAAAAPTTTTSSAAARERKR